jgi:hypothetical protein
MSEQEILVNATPRPWKANIARHGRNEEGDMFGFSITADGKKPMIASSGIYESERAVMDNSDFGLSWKKAFPSEAAQYFFPEEAAANAQLIALAVNSYESDQLLLNQLVTALDTADIVLRAASSGDGRGGFSFNERRHAALDKTCAALAAARQKMKHDSQV